MRVSARTPRRRPWGSPFSILIADSVPLLTDTWAGEAIFQQSSKIFFVESQQDKAAIKVGLTADYADSADFLFFIRVVRGKSSRKATILINCTARRSRNRPALHRGI